MAIALAPLAVSNIPVRAHEWAAGLAIELRVRLACAAGLASEGLRQDACQPLCAGLGFSVHAAICQARLVLHVLLLLHFLALLALRSCDAENLHRNIQRALDMHTEPKSPQLLPSAPNCHRGSHLQAFLIGPAPANRDNNL